MNYAEIVQVEEQSLFQMIDGGAVPTSPLQLKIVKLNVHSACKYNRKWHSRLPVIDWGNVVRNKHYICFGASFEITCYAVAIWSSPIAQNRFKNGEKILELRRMAISPEAPKNTASRMIKVMISMIKKEFPDIDRLISYQDTEVHRGTIYKASGWEIGGTSKGIKWNTEKRIRNNEQTLAEKIRWEKYL